MLEDFFNQILYFPNGAPLPPKQLLFMLSFIAWNLFWKGWALWKSARRDNKKWFIVLMVFQTLGILDIFYLILTSRKKEKKAGVV